MIEESLMHFVGQIVNGAETYFNAHKASPPLRIRAEFLILVTQSIAKLQLSTISSIGRGARKGEEGEENGGTSECHSPLLLFQTTSPEVPCLDSVAAVNVPIKLFHTDLGLRRLLAKRDLLSTREIWNSQKWTKDDQNSTLKLHDLSCAFYTFLLGQIEQEKNSITTYSISG
ncbi:unnamed protein product [Gongylonema pulchrum]|uniref:Uncharacterized protein n=1 Tax=Gongylonema pulchrum TaxID=637853 RepID=A0A183EG10_9BILA|nr:unnamed protein product [Gongylonema pulchrum]